MKRSLFLVLKRELLIQPPGKGKEKAAGDAGIGLESTGGMKHKTMDKVEGLHP
jgi:hypothetical protein